MSGNYQTKLHICQQGMLYQLEDLQDFPTVHLCEEQGGAVGSVGNEVGSTVCEVLSMAGQNYASKQL